jgi:serine/threonine protein kinase
MEPLEPTVISKADSNTNATLGFNDLQNALVQPLTEERLLATVPRQNFACGSIPVLGGVPLLAKIGQGGMGAVYLGIDPKTKREVAVKVLPLQMDEKTNAVDRFLREARLATQVSSPHVVQVYDVGHDGQLYFFLMEYVRGKSVGGLLREKIYSGAMGFDEATALTICIAATKGLAAAHSIGIIHRDVKPDNILVPLNQETKAAIYAEAKVADLGLARSLDDQQTTMTATNMTLGTPGYMAPEQARDAKRAELTADVFSVGATLYALLAGRAPFHGSTGVDTILATLTRQQLPVRRLRNDVSEATEELIERCLTKEPRVRYENAAKLLDALQVCHDMLWTPGATVKAPSVLKGTASDKTVASVAQAAARTKVESSHGGKKLSLFPEQKSKLPIYLPLAAGCVLVSVGMWMIFKPGEDPAVEGKISIAQLNRKETDKAPVANALETRATKSDSESPDPRATLGIPPPPPATLPTQPAVSAGQEAQSEALKKLKADEEDKKVRQKEGRQKAADEALLFAAKLAVKRDEVREDFEAAKKERDGAQTELTRLQTQERQKEDELIKAEDQLKDMRDRFAQQPPPPPPKQGRRRPDDPRPENGPPEEMRNAEQSVRQLRDAMRPIKDQLTKAREKVRELSEETTQLNNEFQLAERDARRAAAQAARKKERIENPELPELVAE